MFKEMLKYLVKKAPCLKLDGTLLVRKKDDEIPELFIDLKNGNTYVFSVDTDPDLMTESEAHRKMVRELQELQMVLYELKPLYSYNPQTKNLKRLS